VGQARLNQAHLRRSRRLARPSSSSGTTTTAPRSVWAPPRRQGRQQAGRLPGSSAKCWSECRAQRCRDGWAAAPTSRHGTTRPRARPMVWLIPPPIRSACASIPTMASATSTMANLGPRGVCFAGRREGVTGMPMHVVNGALLICTQGAAPSVLVVLSISSRCSGYRAGAGRGSGTARCCARR
jgi:hypothetical protein